MRRGASHCAPLERASAILLCLAAPSYAVEQVRNAAKRARVEGTLARFTAQQAAIAQQAGSSVHQDISPGAGVAQFSYVTDWL